MNDDIVKIWELVSQKNTDVHIQHKTLTIDTSWCRVHKCYEFCVSNDSIPVVYSDYMTFDELEALVIATIHAYEEFNTEVSLN